MGDEVVRFTQSTVQMKVRQTNCLIRFESISRPTSLAPSATLIVEVPAELPNHPGLLLNPFSKELRDGFGISYCSFRIIRFPQRHRRFYIDIGKILCDDDPILC